MLLAAPWFLAGLAALGLPLYLHLLRRQTTTPRPFSSLMFFEPRTQASTRHRRLRYFLLLSLRLLLLLLLILAFADPTITRDAAAVASNRILLVVVDNSFSMRAAAPGAPSSLDNAKSAALDALARRGPNERGQVMSLGGQLHILTEPTRDPGVLRAAVAAIQPGDGHADFAALARALGPIAAAAQAPVELHLFSDLRQSSLPANFNDLVLPANVALVLHPALSKTLPAWSVESLQAPSQVSIAQSTDPKSPSKPQRVEAIIAGYGTPAATRRVALLVNGQTLATQSVAIPANGRVPIVFTSLIVPYGFSRCEVRLLPDPHFPDPLPADARFTVQRSDPQRVLFVHSPADTRSPLYFGAALAAADQSAFILESVSADQVADRQPNQYAFVVLSDVLSLPAAFQTALRQYVQAGGSLLIAAGPSALGRASVPILDAPILGTHDYARPGTPIDERWASVADADPSYPAIEKADRWAGVKFFYSVRVNPGAARVVARLSDQTPLLLDQKIGEGRVLFLASGLDNLTNDFPLHPDFVPFVEQTALYLAGSERRGSARQVDAFYDLRTSREQAIGVEVTDPDGRPALSLAASTSAQTFQLARAGFYQIRLANGRQDLVAVNPDPRESNLALIPQETLALWGGAPASSTSAGPAGALAALPPQKIHQSLWWYVMLLLLAAALAESLLAARYLGTQREAP